MQIKSVKRNLAILTLVISTIVIVSGNISTADAAPEEKIWICHATSSETNPYVLLQINKSAWNDDDGKGHGDDGAPDRHRDSLDLSLCTDPDTDTTAPEISYSAECTIPGNNGWCIGEVQIVWTVEDAESEVSNSSGCEDISVNYDTTGVSFTCEATSEGGTNSVTTEEFKIDSTAPVTLFDSQTPEANENGWNNSAVDVNFSCSDETSGVLTDSVIVSLTEEGAEQSATAQCEDSAGNTSDATVSGINIDLTAPTFGGIEDSYLLDQPVDVSCDDSLSGIATCDATLDTENPGTNTSSISASDLAGNLASLDLTYQVFYELACNDGDDGFSSPLDNSNYNIGRTIPMKFDACNYYGDIVENVVATAFIDDQEATTKGKSNDGNLFRYSEDGQQYIYNADTTGYSVGVYTLYANLDDGQTISETVEFTEKSKKK